MYHSYSNLASLDNQFDQNFPLDSVKVKQSIIYKIESHEIKPLNANYKSLHEIAYLMLWLHNS